MREKMIVSYLHCKCRARGSHIEDNRGQGVIPFWKWKRLSWCGYEEKRVESGAPIERRSAAKVKKVARPREAKAQQSGARSGEPKSAAEQHTVRRTGKHSKRGG